MTDPYEEMALETFFYSAGMFPRHPKGYHQSPRYTLLRGHNHCQHCLCSPCVIALPPDFLRGSCGPHPANDGKRHRLYRMFWGLLNTLGVWKDEEYLQRKKTQTVRDDKRDIIPKCIITVSVNNFIQVPNHKIIDLMHSDSLSFKCS